MVTKLLILVEGKVEPVYYYLGGIVLDILNWNCPQILLQLKAEYIYNNTRTFSSAITQLWCCFLTNYDPLSK